MSLRILFLGENWYGSCARACCHSLRRLGCDVVDIDGSTFYPPYQRYTTRLVKRLFRAQLYREYNDAVLQCADMFPPDMLLAFKGGYVRRETLVALRQRGVALFNYYPDTSAFAHGPLLATSLPEYDCVFATKRFWADDVRRKVPLRDSVFIPHGYDPELHQPLPLDDRDRAQFGCDVVFIAVHTRYKEEMLTQVVRKKPELDLQIWGRNWRERCGKGPLAKYIRGGWITGTPYVKTLLGAKICLGLMSGPDVGSSQGDETSTRTYEIPACGAFLLHERTRELAELFEPEQEVACFGDADELCSQIEYYLARPADRERIARAGHSRCVPAYSYDRRMEQLLDECDRRMPGHAAAVQPRIAGVPR